MCETVVSYGAAHMPHSAILMTLCAANVEGSTALVHQVVSVEGFHYMFNVDQAYHGTR